MSNKDIEELGVWYVAALHEPIVDLDGSPDVLCADRYVGGRWVNAYWDDPQFEWDAGGAFAFVVPVSASSSDTEDEHLESQPFALPPTLTINGVEYKRV